MTPAFLRLQVIVNFSQYRFVMFIFHQTYEYLGITQCFLSLMILSVALFYCSLRLFLEVYRSTVDFCVLTLDETYSSDHFFRFLRSF